MIVELVLMACRSLLAHKLRSALTMLGITIGVGSIIAIVAIGKGGESALSSKLANGRELQSEVIFTPHADAPEHVIMNPPTFTADDVRAISEIPYVKEVIRYNSTGATLMHGNRRLDLDIKGGDSFYPQIHHMDLQLGSWEALNLDSGSGIWLSEEAAKRLMEQMNPIGAIVRCNGVPLQVLGVYKEESVMAEKVPSAFISLSLWPQLFHTKEVQNLSITAASDTLLTQAEHAAVTYLNQYKDTTYGTYEVFNVNELKKSLATVSNVMTLLISCIAGISLAVGGVGVMNIMLVSVTERTREIGIRKALGATRKAILFQFLVESTVITSIGGILGIGLGVGGAFIVSYFAKWPPLISVWVILGAVLFSMTLGIVFGLLPAHKASRLTPIEALRYE